MRTSSRHQFFTCFGIISKYYRFTFPSIVNTVVTSQDLDLKYIHRYFVE